VASAPRHPTQAPRASVRPAVWIIALHAAVLLAHEVAHRQLGVDLALWQAVFAYAVIVAGPLLALALLWVRPRAGFALLALSMAGALVFTTYHHYVGVSPDHVAHLPPGQTRGLFRWTAAALALLEAAGVVVGWRGWSRTPTLAVPHDPTDPNTEEAQA
jgi:hypothetical protein